MPLSQRGTPTGRGRHSSLMRELGSLPTKTPNMCVAGGAHQTPWTRGENALPCPVGAAAEPPQQKCWLGHPDCPEITGNSQASVHSAPCGTGARGHHRRRAAKSLQASATPVTGAPSPLSAGRQHPCLHYRRGLGFSEVPSDTSECSKLELWTSLPLPFSPLTCSSTLASCSSLARVITPRNYKSVAVRGSHAA